jgi:Flp pilus assembly protein TadB
VKAKKTCGHDGRMFSAASSSVELRVRLWRENQEMAEHVLRQQHDLDGQVVVLCDTADDIGGPLSEALAEKAGCLDELERHRRKVLAKGNEAQTTIIVLPVNVVAELLKDSNPTVAAALKQPARSGTIYAVIIGFGGSTLLAAPRPACRASAGVG